MVGDRTEMTMCRVPSRTLRWCHARGSMASFSGGETPSRRFKSSRRPVFADVIKFLTRGEIPPLRLLEAVGVFGSFVLSSDYTFDAAAALWNPSSPLHGPVGGHVPAGLPEIVRVGPPPLKEGRARGNLDAERFLTPLCLALGPGAVHRALSSVHEAGEAARAGWLPVVLCDQLGINLARAEKAIRLGASARLVLFAGDPARCAPDILPGSTAPVVPSWLTREDRALFAANPLGETLEDGLPVVHIPLWVRPSGESTPVGKAREEEAGSVLLPASWHHILSHRVLDHPSVVAFFSDVGSKEAGPGFQGGCSHGGPVALRMQPTADDDDDDHTKMARASARPPKFWGLSDTIWVPDEPGDGAGTGSTECASTDGWPLLRPPSVRPAVPSAMYKTVVGKLLVSSVRDGLVSGNTANDAFVVREDEGEEPATLDLTSELTKRACCEIGAEPEAAVASADGKPPTPLERLPTTRFEADPVAPCCHVSVIPPHPTIPGVLDSATIGEAVGLGGHAAQFSPLRVRQLFYTIVGVNPTHDAGGKLWPAFGRDSTVPKPSGRCYLYPNLSLSSLPTHLTWVMPMGQVADPDGAKRYARQRRAAEENPMTRRMRMSALERAAAYNTRNPCDVHVMDEICYWLCGNPFADAEDWEEDTIVAQPDKPARPAPVETKLEQKTTSD
jgi:hypothetical protein